MCKYKDCYNECEIRDDFTKCTVEDGQTCELFEFEETDLLSDLDSMMEKFEEVFKRNRLEELSMKITWEGKLKVTYVTDYSEKEKSVILNVNDLDEILESSH